MQVLYGQDRYVQHLRVHPRNDMVCCSDTELMQERGSISTTPGLALAFPNIYQHHISPFHLIDPTKPGHRKILAFFLVDPNYTIPSASDVSPQQKEWMLDFMRDLGPNGVRGTRLGKLPAELRDVIVDFTEGLVDRKQADVVREELMKERSHFASLYNEHIMQLPFNMCEH